MNFVGTTTYEGTKKDADDLYSMFKDEIAKYLKNLLGGPNKSLGDLIEEYLRKIIFNIVILRILMTT